MVRHQQGKQNYTLYERGGVHKLSKISSRMSSFLFFRSNKVIAVENDLENCGLTFHFKVSGYYVQGWYPENIAVFSHSKKKRILMQFIYTVWLTDSILSSLTHAQMRTETTFFDTLEIRTFFTTRPSRSRCFRY